MNDPRSGTAERPDPPAGPRTVLDRFVMPADDWAREDSAHGPRTLEVLMGAMLAALIVAVGAAVAWYQGVAGGGSAFVVILAALSVAAVLAFVTMRRVRRDLHRPLSELYTWALGMCTGDFSTRVPADGESAYRKLAFHINRLSEALERLADDMDDVVSRQTERLREKNESLELLYEVAASIHQLDSIEEILRVSARSMMDVVDASGAMVCLRDAAGEVTVTMRLGACPDGFEPDAGGVHEYDGITISPPSGSNAARPGAGTPRAATGGAGLGTDGSPPEPGRTGGDHAPCAPADSGDGAPPSASAGTGAAASPIAPRDSRPGVVTVPLDHKGASLGVIRLLTASTGPVVESTERRRLLLSVGRHLGMSIAKARTDEESTMLSIVRERAAIAYELHDSLAQTLASLRLQADMLADSLAGSGAGGVPSELTRIRTALDSANIELRELIAGFRAPVDGRDLRAALEEMAARYSAQSALAVHLQVDGDLPELPAGPQLQVVRIVGEALANACAHSGGRYARVLVRSDSASVRVLVEDDGAGFSLPRGDGAPGEHIGLSVMRERARWLGGTLDIESEPGEGTRVALAFPAELGGASAQANVH